MTVLRFPNRDMDTDTRSPRATPDQSRFRSLRARTFEGELLISGAVVFGLLQVPLLIARFFDGR